MLSVTELAVELAIIIDYTANVIGSKHFIIIQVFDEDGIDVTPRPLLQQDVSVNR